MSCLEILPNEILIQITSHLNLKDLQACRLGSSVMRAKIDRINGACFCVIFNERSERNFVKKPKMIPPFTRMRIDSVSYFNGSKGKKTVSLRKEYFQNITELEITEFVPKHYFQQIIKLTGENLRVLKLSSAILGGTEKLFGKYAKISDSTAKPKPMLFLRRALPQPLVKNIRQREENRLLLRNSRINKKWSKLEELHIKLDYVCPSTRNFSTLWLVKNLESVQLLPVSNLNVFAVTVEKSKEAEMFYFTINSLLNAIPLQAYPSLKSVSVVSPKCRPISEQSLEANRKNKEKFSQMQLSNLTVKICEGQSHALPENLIAILEAQQHSLKTVAIEGIRNAHILKLMNSRGLDDLV